MLVRERRGSGGEVFTNPCDKLTEDQITGCFG
jgi:hypothetical protein